jgi:phosphoglycolate phosphatase
LSKTNRQGIDAVFFDLDGTLVDTAPDMVASLQRLQRDHGREPVTYDLARCNVSNGAMGLLKLGFPDLDEAARQLLICEYIDIYAQRVCDLTIVFPGLEQLLLDLETGCRPWGVVTNKPEHLTNPLMVELGLAKRSAATVSGDTLSKRKPHPEPLWHACEIANVDPERTLYVGDAQRDIEAGQRAGMVTIAAAYGYIPHDDDPGAWGADQIAADVADLAQMVLKAVNLVP